MDAKINALTREEKERLVYWAGQKKPFLCGTLKKWFEEKNLAIREKYIAKPVKKK